jgi:protein TonB
VNEERTNHHSGGDPLVDARPSAQTMRRRYVGFAAATLLLYGLLAVGLEWWAATRPEAASEGEREAVEVAVVESEPEPPPPEPPPKPAPEPEPPPKPAPEPEPPPDTPPETAPPSEPESPPEPNPDSTPPSEPAASKTTEESSSPPEAESLDPVELQGLSEESTVDNGSGPTMKVGESIETGEVTDEYVDPERMDDIETGGGDGEGRGGSETPGRGSSGRRECSDQSAEIARKVRVDPEDYPSSARREGVEGTIVATLRVSPDGTVESVELRQTLGYGLDELAREAFRQWRFEPAREKCRAVASDVRVTHRFELE